MGALLWWISHTRTVVFHEILIHNRCHLASRSLAVSSIFPRLIVIGSHLDFISPLLEVSLRCSLPLSINTAHVLCPPGELSIPSRSRQAHPVIPYPFLSSFSYARG